MIAPIEYRVALHMFSYGRTIYGLPEGQSPEGSFFRLIIQPGMSFNHRIDWYREHYLEGLVGSTIQFYTEPMQAIAKSVDGKYYLSSRDGKRLSPLLSIPKLIHFANQNVFQVVNGKYISERQFLYQAA